MTGGKIIVLLLLKPTQCYIFICVIVSSSNTSYPYCNWEICGGSPLDGGCFLWTRLVRDGLDCDVRPPEG